MSQDGVHVQIGMGNQDGKKAPETLAEVQAAPAAAAACSNNACSPSAWSSKCMWGAFLLGWIFPPAWWAGVAGGLRCGKDNECFLKRRDGTCTLAWVANVLMSFVSAVVLILVLSIVFGRPGPQQDGPYYIAMSGQGDVFPNFNNAAALTLLAQAVHAGLALPSTYPYSSISIWLESSASLPTSPTPTRRRLLVDTTTPLNETTQVAVLGYTLEKTPELPASEKLTTRIEDGSAADEVSTKLVTLGLVKPEGVGKLQLGLIAKVRREDLASLLANKDNPAFSLVPVGKRCKGEWTEWTACELCGNSTRIFIIPGADAEAPTADQTEQNETRRHLLERGGSKNEGQRSEDGKDTGRTGRPGAGMPNLGPQVAAMVHIVQQAQAQGLAHAFGLVHGMGLALGHIECAVVNNTEEVRACTATCPGYCTEPPATGSADGTVSFEWQCGSGSYNTTDCEGTCSATVNAGSIVGIATAKCSNSTYEPVVHNCTESVS